MTELRVVKSPAIEKVEELQAALMAMPSVAFEKKYHFAKGVHARELIIPKGVVLVGRIHLQSQINIISKGDISVLMDDGVKRIKAPFTLVTPAGVKRAGYAHEETIWTTILGTELTDPEEIYETLTVMNFEDYVKFLRDGIPPRVGEKTWPLRS